MDQDRDWFQVFSGFGTCSDNLGIKIAPSRFLGFYVSIITWPGAWTSMVRYEKKGTQYEEHCRP
jgi:hypothetical protein